MKKKDNWIFIVVVILIIGAFAFSGFAFYKKYTQAEVDAIIDGAKEPQPNEPDPIIIDNPTVDDGDDDPVLPPSDPTPDPSTPDIICDEPKGRFLTLMYRSENSVTADAFHQWKNKPEVVGEFMNLGNCKTQFYIEAGVINSPTQINWLTVAPAIRKDVEAFGAPSICDGNKHYNGVLVELEPMQRVIFLLKPENYGVEAEYPLVMGAYTGCMKDGGKVVETFKGKVMFSDKFVVSQIDSSWAGFASDI